MNEERFIELLKSAGEFNLDVSESCEKKILDHLQKRPIEGRIQRLKAHLSSSVLLRPVLALLIIGIAGIFYISIQKGNHVKINPQQLYNRIITEIQAINSERDINKALSIYSDEFFKVSGANSRAELKKNIETLFKNYNNIEYKPEKKKVIIRKNNALIENNIQYYAKATDNSIKPLIYQGKERIYLKRYRDTWKIVAWVYEDK